jgi:hypothetical protein
LRKVTVKVKGVAGPLEQEGRGEQKFEGSISKPTVVAGGEMVSVSADWLIALARTTGVLDSVSGGAPQTDHPVKTIIAGENVIVRPAPVRVGTGERLGPVTGIRVVLARYSTVGDEIVYGCAKSGAVNEIANMHLLI